MPKLVPGAESSETYASLLRAAARAARWCAAESREEDASGEDT